MGLERERDGRGNGVAAELQAADEAVVADAKLALQLVEQQRAGLVQDHQVVVVDGAARLGHDPRHRLGHGPEGEGHHLSPVHIEVGRTADVAIGVGLRQGLELTGDPGRAGPAGGHDQVLGPAAVGAEDEGADGAFALHAPDQRRRRGVAEQGAHAAVQRMDQLGIGVAGDQQHAVGRAGGDQALDHRQGIDEAGTSKALVQHPAVGPEAQPPVQQRGVARQGMVGGLGAEHHEVDLAGGGPGLGQQLQRRLFAQVQGGLVEGGDAPLAHAGLVDDLGRRPVRKQFGQGVAGQHALRELARDRRDLAGRHHQTRRPAPCGPGLIVWWKP